MTAEPMLNPEPPYLRGLNPPQREAVLTTDGPVLMLAGAGTGKTSALTARLAHIIATGRAWPSQLLAVTFTNKAAREMQHRVGGLIGQAVEGMAYLGTFHSVAARMLRRHAELVGLKSNFTILDMDDQQRLLKQVLALEDIDDKRWPARVLGAIIDRWKNAALRPDQVPPGEAHSFADGKAIRLYSVYQERLKALNACDFGDLLLHMLTILQSHTDVLADYHKRFRYILVDEYQDTNVAQYLWLRLLAQGSGNICCVGDDDQSIYGWRGAEVGNILKFEKDFPGAKVIRLEQNYRSTPEILAVASALIAGNSQRLGKTLWTQAPDTGEKVRVIGVWDGPEEARTVSDLIESRQHHGDTLDSMAILVRASFQTREFEERFLLAGLAYRIVGGFRFYERAEVRDAIAYLRLINQPADDLAFERIVNLPKRGLGDKALQTLHQFARARAIPLLEAAAILVTTDELGKAARTALGGFVGLMNRWRVEAEQLGQAQLARMVLDESGYMAMWQADRSTEAAGRIENLNELVRAMEEFETLEGFLEHVSLVMDNEAAVDTPKVTVMTLHAAKGLEFDTVFLAGWEEGVFPSQRTLDENGLAGLEEERRLAYVGLTRARRRAIILHAANRRVYGQWQASIPSRFIEDLPRDAIDREQTTAGAGASMWRSVTYDDPFANAARGSGRGPGWERAQARGFSVRGQSPVIEARASAVSFAANKPSAFAAGARVFHVKFGYGTVRAVDGNKLDIAFDKAGQKNVVDSFVTAA